MTPEACVRGGEPRVVIDRAHRDRLESLAYGARRRLPELADLLLDELTRARVVDAADMPPDVVTIGNAVTYRDDSTALERTVTLAFPQEADISLGRISVLTPIGVALLGLSERASFEWETRRGEVRQLTITRVMPAATAAGQATAPSRAGEPPDRSPG